jgi:hypothetical protein
MLRFFFDKRAQIGFGINSSAQRLRLPVDDPPATPASPKLIQVTKLNLYMARQIPAKLVLDCPGWHIAMTQATDGLRPHTPG